MPVLDADGRRSTTTDDSSPAAIAIRRYRPRIEGLFARIERWTRRRDGDVHWRSISPDNVTHHLRQGRAEPRSPTRPTRARVFSWLICETRDDKGNAIVYDYKAEDGTGVDLTQAHEQHRGRRRPSRTANRYLERIRYGNAATLLDAATSRRPRILSQTRSTTRAGCSSSCSTTASTDATPDAGPTSGHGRAARTRSHLPRRLRGAHLPAVPARADVPPLPGRAGVGARLPGPLARPRLSHDAAAQTRAATPATASSRRRRSASYQRDGRRRGTAVSCRRSSSPTAKRRSTTRCARSTPAALENLPVGLGGRLPVGRPRRRGLSGVLTEQAGAWYYKPNLGGGPLRAAVRPLRRSRPARRWPRSTRPAATARPAGRRRSSTWSTSHAPLAGLLRARRRRGLEAVRPVRDAAQHRLERSEPALRRPRPATASPTR